MRFPEYCNDHHIKHDGQLAFTFWLTNSREKRLSKDETLRFLFADMPEGGWNDVFAGFRNRWLSDAGK
jgi:hypothetical protein